METLTIITGYVTGAKVCSCYNLFYSWNSSVWITAIICLTILLLAIIWVCVSTCKNKNNENHSQRVNSQTSQDTTKQVNDKEEAKEKRLYRERLLNFLEKRTIDKVIKERKTVNGVETETTTVTYKDGNQECKEYTDMLKSLIKDLTPTN